jgi:hypothetical protein
MNLIIIHPSRHTDLDILFRFEQGVIAAERPFDPTLKKDPIHYYDLQAMIDAPEINLVAIKAYEKAGFSQHMINMRQGITP